MMEAKFIDYYEILEISPNANSGTIERMFRYLAQRYHPDNQDTGDRLRFDAVLEANDALRDPERRAQYDIQHKEQMRLRARLVNEAGDSRGIEGDVEIQNKILLLLYAKRRQNVGEPGIGDVELEQLLGCPAELLEFHLWYLKEKGWIRRSDNGMLAITVEGVDRADTVHHHKFPNKLLRDQSSAGQG
jgi:curved DNA-binding protein CbpA